MLRYLSRLPSSTGGAGRNGEAVRPPWKKHLKKKSGVGGGVVLKATSEGKGEARGVGKQQTQKEKNKEQLTSQSLGPAGQITVSRGDPCTVHAI